MNSQLKNLIPFRSRREVKVLPTRLGTAHSCFALLTCLLSTVALPAQEDVAETKSNIQIDTTPITEPAISPADREHWSFQPVKRLLPPEIPNPKSKIQSPVDPFILANLNTKNLSLSPPADRSTLLRRLSFDLTGLPPTPAELTAYENENRPDAYERQLDRLLASTAYGERYGQYWLDLARFAETDGYEFDTVRPHAWKFRDWVIAAFNADLPYDALIRHQIAGDEQQEPNFYLPGIELLATNPPADAAKSKKPPAPPPSLAQIPTTFCLAGPDMPDVNDQVERRHGVLNELTGTVGAALLGLQLGCAQCHNHKYDPISQADFYRLRAVFESAVPAYKRDVPNNTLANQQSPLTARLYLRGDHRRPGVEVPPAFPRIATLSPTQSADNSNAAGSNSAILTPQSTISTAKHSRSEFADWLVGPDNPLTPRVIANRLWQWHFGRGLCQTPSDFGVMGGPLTHPELLDYLATEIRDRGWSMKQLHRTILTSATYRQSSTLAATSPQPSSAPNSPSLDPSVSLSPPEPRTTNPDPDNALYSRFPRQRLTGEAIRDAMLAAAGLLTTERGGPGVMPPLPPELVGTLLKNQWSTSKREPDHYKRSIYVFARRNLRLPIFEAFDRPDGNATCPERNRSTTAPQSLLLFNSEHSLLAAQHLAGRALAASESPAQQIDALYRLTLSRLPTAAESQAVAHFREQQRRRLAAEARPATELALPIPLPPAADPYAAVPLVDVCLAIMNTNEFIYID